MTIPSTFFTRETLDCEGCHAWNDPRRQLYPHHAELWPEDIPEHVCFERQAKKLRKEKQRVWLRAFFRFRWLRAVADYARAPRLPRFELEDPMERRTDCKPLDSDRNGNHSDNG